MRQPPGRIVNPRPAARLRRAFARSVLLAPCLCGSRTERGNPAHILFAFRVPRIVSRLHAYPNSRAISKQLAEPNRNGRRDRLALAQNVIEMLPGNTQK